MKKKMWFSIVAVCLSMFMLIAISACEPAAETSEEDPIKVEASTAETTATAAVVETPKEKYTFTVVRSYSVPPLEDGEIKKHIEEKYNVNLDLWYIEGTNWNDVLAVRFASKEIPDYLEVQGFQTLGKYVEEEILAEIDVNMLKEAAPYIYSNVIKEDTLNVLRYTSINGKCYSLPTVTANMFHNAIVWRGDWLKKIGMEKYPETFEDFEKAMYAFAKQDPDGNNKNDTYGMSQTGIPLVFGAYGYQPDRWMLKDGKLVHGSIQPEMKESLAVLNKWYKDGVLDPEFVTGENQGGYYAFSHSFFNSHVGLTCLGAFYHWKPVFYTGDSKSECYLELQKINPAALEALQFGVPPKKNGIGGAPATSTIINSTSLGFGKQLESDPAKFKALFELLEGLSSDYEGYLESIFGIKGKHWDFDKTTGLPGFINENTSKTVDEQGVFGGMESSEYCNNRAKPRFDWAYANNFDVDCMENELVAPLPSDEKYKAELEKLQLDTYTKIIRGDLPVSYFDEYVIKWNQSGGEQLTKEANEWYASMK